MLSFIDTPFHTHTDTNSHSFTHLSSFARPTHIERKKTITFNGVVETAHAGFNGATDYMYF